MSLSVRTYAGVSLISLGLVAIGFYGGARRVSASMIAPPRFEKLSETTALDTSRGVVCSTVSGYPQIDPNTGERVQNIPPPCVAR